MKTLKFCCDVSLSAKPAQGSGAVGAGVGAVYRVESHLRLYAAYWKASTGKKQDRGWC